MRRKTWQLAELREECRKAQSVDDLKAILDVVIDHLYFVEKDHWFRKRQGPYSPPQQG
jgi:hypothetical protein